MGISGETCLARTAKDPRGAIYGWGDWPVWALIALGLALLAPFAYQAPRISRDPVLDPRLFARLECALTNLVISRAPRSKACR